MKGLRVWDFGLRGLALEPQSFEGRWWICRPKCGASKKNGRNSEQAYISGSSDRGRQRSRVEGGGFTWDPKPAV